MIRRVEIQDLAEIAQGCISTKVPLSKISRWRVGGVADVIATPRNIEQLVALRRMLFEGGIPHVVIGGTTNLLFSDEGLRVPCIRISSALEKVSIVKNIVNAEAGIWVPKFARTLYQAGLSGAEHICGIPGTLGGLICMNGGSLRQSISQSLIDVTSVTADGTIVVRSENDCDFGYRRSCFQVNDEIILSARFRFELVADKRSMRRQMLSILESRRKKFPRLPNCGSVFKSDPSMYASIGPPGAVIERLGWKGASIGDATVSTHHANFILNRGNARSEDIRNLIRNIQDDVLQRTGFMLETEVRFVTPDGLVEPAGDIPNKVDA